MKPHPLSHGDEIRIISPSGAIHSKYIDGSTQVLKSWGLHVSEGEFARGEYGRFAGTIAQRLSDLQDALDDPKVRAILCSRGGYGLSQLVDSLDFSSFCKSPKWLIGFSDISVLHNAISHHGISSLHGIMAKHLTELSTSSEQVSLLKEILFGTMPSYSIASHALNRKGTARGRLIGGNLSVLMGLRGTRFDLDYKDGILFIEDLAEQPYHIDRMMQNLRISGALSGLSGLVVGQFSDCNEDPRMMKTVSEIILDAVDAYSYPVCFDFPAGHVDYNLPIVLNAAVHLSVDDEGAKLRYF